MFGGPSKLGRGGGAGRGFDGGPKRFPSLSQPIRPPGPPHGRLSMPGPRNRTPAPPAAPPAVEETFSLVSGKNPLTFAMIIRLAPDLIDEIRRVEAQGGAARIKFDANPNNSSGNQVIDVGGKEFRFTWSKEFGDLCDIYEERQNGEDGNGLLVESGSAWRKLNVQRVLDESTTNHVKMRSVEAERKKELRKTIILDNGNPKTKKQVPASEANPWRTGFKKKEPPPKKQKIDTPLVPSGAAVKPTQKSGSTPSSSKPVGKGPRSVSPLPFPQDPFQPVASPSSGLNISKSTEEIIVPIQLRNEDSDRDLSIKSSGFHDKSASKLELGAKPPTDLQSMITSLLKENPKGMSLKALEKAIGDTFPSSGKMIEPILKRIAVYQAPGRYLLKQELEAEGTKGPSPGRTSPFDNSNIHIPISASEPTFDKEVRQEEGFAELNTTEFDTSENIDIEQHSPDILGDKKDSVRDSSSDSGSSSDSDSASSDSGSDSPSGSRSRSKSRSPVRSGGSSDSESADSSNKEGSDEEVDIISDDDKPKPGQDPGPAAPSPPIPNGNDSDIVDIDGDVNEERAESVRGGGSPNQDDVETKQNLIGSLFEDDSTFGGPDPTLRGKSKRGTDFQNDDVGPGHVKRSRVENAPSLPVHGRYSSSPHEPTPDWSREMTKLPLNQTVPGKFSNLPPQQQMQRLSGQQPTSYDSSWRINKHGGPGESLGQVGAFSDKSYNADLGRSSKGTPESYGPRPSRSGSSGRHSLPFESHKNLGPGPGPVPGPIFKESLRVNGRGPVLQREVSDLELGELREPIPEEGPTKKTFERRGSFNDTRPKPPPKSENFPRQRTLEQRDEEAAIPQPQIPSRPTNTNGTAPVSKIPEVKFKRNGILAAPGIVSDKDGPPKIDNRTAVAPHQTKKETRTQVVVANGGKKRKESSSDENSCSYLKYEKDEPELKGRIRDLSQYNEYVQEYREKYDSYCSLNKVVEGYRQDFLNLGRELDNARGRDTDRYNNIESQIMKSYSKCGTKYKRLKKIFTVLHEELKHLKQMIADFAQVNSKD